MTYSWSLSWANVDKAFYVEQETKAGFWNQDIQVFLIKEYIQGLCMSLGDLRQPLSGQSKSNPESWHRGLGRFLQPVGTWQVLEQILSINMFLLCSGRTKKSFDTPWVSADNSRVQHDSFCLYYKRKFHQGKDPFLSSLYGLLIILTPGSEAATWLREERTLSLLRRGVRRLLYR